MTFLPGNPGRPKGIRNTRTRQLEDIADRVGVDLFEVLCMFAKGDWAGLGYSSESTISYTNAGIEYEELVIKPELRLHAAKEGCKYLHAQRKAVEHSPADPLSDMTPQQKLEAMKNAVAIAEMQLKNDGSGDV